MSDDGSAEPVLPIVPTTPGVEESENLTLIVAVIAGCMVFILILGSIIALWGRRKKTKKITQPTFKNPTGYAIYNYDPDPAHNLI